VSIVDCPNCDKPVSSLISLCPYCGFQRGQVSEEEVKELRRRKLRDHIYHLQMTSYLVITLFLGAFGWYWSATRGFRYPSSMGPVILLAITSVIYLGLRIYLYRSKVMLRKIKH